jgi:hypothetical protein
VLGQGSLDARAGRLQRHQENFSVRLIEVGSYAASNCGEGSQVARERSPCAEALSVPAACAARHERSDHPQAHSKEFTRRVEFWIASRARKVGPLTGFPSRRRGLPDAARRWSVRRAQPPRFQSATAPGHDGADAEPPRDLRRLDLGESPAALSFVAGLESLPGTYQPPRTHRSS